MFYYSLDQGEGIAGLLSEVGAKTTTLFSCSGITMINEGSDLGGLYHYSCRSMSYPNVKSTLTAMLSEIAPAVIHVTPAQAMLGVREDVIAEDLREVVGFLKSRNPTIDVRVLHGRCFASYFRFQGSLRLNEFHPYGVTFDRVREDRVHNVFMAGPRILDTGALYFGVNGEEHLDQLRPLGPAPTQALHQQGLRTGRLRLSRKCVIS